MNNMKIINSSKSSAQDLIKNHFKQYQKQNSPININKALVPTTLLKKLLSTTKKQEQINDLEKKPRNDILENKISYNFIQNSHERKIHTENQKKLQPQNRNQSAYNSSNSNQNQLNSPLSSNSSKPPIIQKNNIQNISSRNQNVYPAAISSQFQSSSSNNLLKKQQALLPKNIMHRSNSYLTYKNILENKNSSQDKQSAQEHIKQNNQTTQNDQKSNKFQKNYQLYKSGQSLKVNNENEDVMLNNNKNKSFKKNKKIDNLNKFSCGNLPPSTHSIKQKHSLQHCTFNQEQDESQQTQSSFEGKLNQFNNNNSKQNIEKQRQLSQERKQTNYNVNNNWATQTQKQSMNMNSILASSYNKIPSEYKFSLQKSSTLQTPLQSSEKDIRSINIITKEDNNIGECRNIEIIQSKNDSQEQQTKINIEIFQNLLKKISDIQKSIEQYINVKKKEQIKSCNIDFIQRQHIFPLVKNNVKSFKEIADGVINQMEYLKNFGLFDVDEKQNKISINPISILKNTKNSRTTSSCSRQSSQNQSGRKINFNINDQENEINIQKQLIKKTQQLKQKDDINNDLTIEINYIQLKNSELQKQVIQQNIQIESERDKFYEDINSLHINTDKNFQNLQNQHNNILQNLKQEYNIQLQQQSMDLNKYMEEIQQCQLQIHQLNTFREEHQKSLQNIQKSSADDESISNFLELPNGKKNQLELQAEIDFYKESVLSLEIELKTFQLELQNYKKQQSNIQLLQNQILEIESENQNIKQELEEVVKQKQWYEKEYQIQISQIENQNQRLQISCLNCQNVDFKNIQLLQGKVNENTAEKQNMVNQVLLKDKSFEKNNSFVKESTSNNKQQLQVDKSLIIQSQSKIMEKLLIKVKKLQQNQVNKDFSIFKTEDEDNFNFNSKSIKNQEYPVIELKTYKEHINDLYQIIKKQSDEQFYNNKELTHNEQYTLIKSYLTIQTSIGSLKKYRYDENFSDFLQLQEIQNIFDNFFEGEKIQQNEKIYRTQDQIIKQKNNYFHQMHKIMLQNLAQFFVIYQQMLNQKNMSQQYQLQLKDFKNSKITSSKNEDDNMIQKIQNQNEEQMQSIFKLKRQLEIYTSETNIDEDLFNMILKQIDLQENDKKILQSKSIIQFNKTLQINENKTQKDKILSQNLLDMKRPRSQQKQSSYSNNKKLNSYNSSSLFKSRKPWHNNQDSDLNHILDKLNHLEQEYDYLEKEKDLCLAENKQLQKDLNDIQNQLKIDQKNYQESENFRIEYEEKYNKLKEKAYILQEDNEQNFLKIERLSNLNEEFSQLINQERLINNEEIIRKDKDCTQKIQQSETKYIIIKNKLLSIANFFRVFIASSFNHEQILDSIIESVCVQKNQQKYSRTYDDIQQDQNNSKEKRNQIQINQQNEDMFNINQQRNYQINKSSEYINSQKYKQNEKYQLQQSHSQPIVIHQNIQDEQNNQNRQISRQPRYNITEKIPDKEKINIDDRQNIRKQSSSKTRIEIMLNNYNEDLKKIENIYIEDEYKKQSNTHNIQQSNEQINEQQKKKEYLQQKDISENLQQNEYEKLLKENIKEQKALDENLNVFEKQLNQFENVNENISFEIKQQKSSFLKQNNQCDVPINLNYRDKQKTLIISGGQNKFVSKYATQFITDSRQNMEINPPKIQENIYFEQFCIQNERNIQNEDNQQAQTNIKNKSYEKERNEFNEKLNKLKWKINQESSSASSLK